MIIIICVYIKTIRNRIEGKEEERGMTYIKRYIQMYTTVMNNNILMRKMLAPIITYLLSLFYRTVCPASQTSASVGF